MYGSPISSAGENSNQGYKMDYCDGTGAMSNPMPVADSLSLASTPNPMNTAQSPGGTVVSLSINFFFIWKFAKHEFVLR